MSLRNQIKDIRVIRKFFDLTELKLEGNPIEIPPPDIIQKGIDAIRRYFYELEENNTQEPIKNNNII